MIIRGARVFSEDCEFHCKDLYLDGDRIVSEDEYFKNNSGDNGKVIDAEGLYAIPGLVDIHFHGAVGHDFCDADPEGLKEIAAYEASCGITAICPATMTYSEEILSGVMENAASFAARQKENAAGSSAASPDAFSDMTEKAQNAPSDMTDVPMADLVGINMEGPFISPDKLGAQNPVYLHRPDVEMFHRLQAKSNGLIRLVDIAPEVDGALEFIEKCAGEVKISLAHNCADYDTALKAFEKGASHMTHLFNAMPGINHRNPGPIIAAMESGAEAELIADNIHVHPAMVRFAFKSFGPDKMILIADSMEATGLADGSYKLGGQAVTKKGNLAVLTEHPETIAGSVTNLYDCMKTAVKIANVPLKDAVRAASLNPARSIGVDKDYGSLEPGAYGNVLLVDEDLNLKTVIIKGRMTKKSK